MFGDRCCASVLGCLHPLFGPGQQHLLCSVSCAVCLGLRPSSTGWNSEGISRQREGKVRKETKKNF